MSQSDPPQSDEPSTGSLRDSYHAALQHGQDEPAGEDLVLGVVREQMYGIQNLIDDNWPALAPTRELLDEFKAKADEVGHNEAVEAVNFADRYRQRLSKAPQQELVAEIVDELQSGTTVWLICYENTEEKFCHRILLKDAILDELQADKEGI